MVKGKQGKMKGKTDVGSNGITKGERKQSSRLGT